ncbi:T9SS type A sorting domain-containing protein [candidate division KSB1 bacterium]|nr:T9SS type A sorting domain-containing protein [candidate division KSB1 bacterium]
MCKINLIAIKSIISLVIFMSISNCPAQLLMQDSFDSPNLDTTKWILYNDKDGGNLEQNSRIYWHHAGTINNDRWTGHGIRTVMNFDDGGIYIIKADYEMTELLKSEGESGTGINISPIQAGRETRYYGSPLNSIVISFGGNIYYRGDGWHFWSNITTKSDFYRQTKPTGCHTDIFYETGNNMVHLKIELNTLNRTIRCWANDESDPYCEALIPTEYWNEVVGVSGQFKIEEYRSWCRISDYGEHRLDNWSITQVLSNQPPIAEAGGPYDVEEGNTILLTGSGDDTDGDNLIYSWDLDQDSHFETPGKTVSYDATALDGPDQKTVTLQLIDSEGLIDIDEASINILNANPVITSFTMPDKPIKVDSEFNATATFIDPGILDTHIADWDWGDGNIISGTICYEARVGTVDGTHIYQLAGIYPVNLTLADDDGGMATRAEKVIIYDPEAGFITGGGWYDSPENSYPTNPSLTGKISFGFVSRYNKNDSLKGQLEFQFKKANINFHSSSYEWLVVNGHKAVLKGEGIINGTGHYGFQLWAIDAKLSSIYETDLFRMKIWDIENSDALVYDNGQTEKNSISLWGTFIEGGKIKIHSKNLKKASGSCSTLAERTSPNEFQLAQNYPNPFNPMTRITFKLPKACDIKLTIYNGSGQLVKTLVSGRYSSGIHGVIWDGRNHYGSSVASGVYMYILQVENKIFIKQMTFFK